MSDLNIIPDGAVLIRDGVIEEVGATRRVENLVPARLARVIDATGRVVMPAFVDPDIALAASHVLSAADGAEQFGRTPISGACLDTATAEAAEATALAADLARYGVLTIGAHTLAAPDLQNTSKALRLHLQTMAGAGRCGYVPFSRRPKRPNVGSSAPTDRRSLATFQFSERNSASHSGDSGYIREGVKAAQS